MKRCLDEGGKLAPLPHRALGDLSRGVTILSQRRDDLNHIETLVTAFTVMNCHIYVKVGSQIDLEFRDVRVKRLPID